MAVAKHKSLSVPKRGAKPADADQRIARTRQRIDAAFVDLLHRRAFGSIRVGDVLRKAKVGRATFYAHYSSKEDLLRSQFERRVSPLLAAAPSSVAGIDATAFLTHIQAAPGIYRGLIVSADRGEAPGVMRECMERRIAELAQPAAGLSRDRLPHGELGVRFVAATLFLVIEDWVNAGMRQTPAELAVVFTRLASRGLS